MQLRRLIVAPVIALATAGLVVAVIDTGQQTRAEANGQTHSVSADPTIAGEQVRIQAAMQAEGRCTVSIECDAVHAARRLRETAASIDRWPPDHHFQDSRRFLAIRLEARAALLEQQALVAGSDDPAPADEQRLAQLESAWSVAARDEIDARRAAGLVSADEQVRLLGELASSSR
ncbi:MAG: hypothetical protein KDC46_15015 [Thermoleophilia bacterium]|nr:hypothetical protein [Thermoleophilia bacterium]